MLKTYYFIDFSDVNVGVLFQPRPEEGKWEEAAWTFLASPKTFPSASTAAEPESAGQTPLPSSKVQVKCSKTTSLLKSSASKLRVGAGIAPVGRAGGHDRAPEAVDQRGGIQQSGAAGEAAQVGFHLQVSHEWELALFSFLVIPMNSAQALFKAWLPDQFRPGWKWHLEGSSLARPSWECLGRFLWEKHG